MTAFTHRSHSTRWCSQSGKFPTGRACLLQDALDISLTQQNKSSQVNKGGEWLLGVVSDSQGMVLIIIEDAGATTITNRTFFFSVYQGPLPEMLYSIHAWRRR